MAIPNVKPDKIKILDSEGEVSNISTEEKQDNIISEMQEGKNDLLKQILLELKIINVHLQSLTDEDVLDADVTKR